MAENRVFVLGAGNSKFGERWDSSAESLLKEALANSGFSGTPDSLIVSSMASGAFISQEHVGAFARDALGFPEIPSLRVEAACASGGVASRVGYLSVKSSESRVCAVAGFEKMTDVGADGAERALSLASDFENEGRLGATFPSLYALIARAHISKFGTTAEELASVSVKNHRNALKNPLAHFRKEITIEEVLSSPVVADPLKVLDCAPVSDGASIIFLGNESAAKEFSESPVEILAFEQGSDTLSLGKRADLTGFRSTKTAGKRAFERAEIPKGKIDIVECHDCFTIAELLALEDLGFFGKGLSGRATFSGETSVSGALPVNPSGGLKAKGHPVGATGVAQIAECFRQLSGTSGNQVKGAKTALAHNVGGAGATATVAILKGEAP